MQNTVFSTSVKLELAHKTDVLVFDKTGTITQGKTSASLAILYGTAEQLCNFWVSLEAKSEHPLGQAILVAAENANLDLLGNG